MKTPKHAAANMWMEKSENINGESSAQLLVKSYKASNVSYPLSPDLHRPRDLALDIDPNINTHT